MKGMTKGGRRNLGQQPIWTGAKSTTADQSKVARRPSGKSLGSRSSSRISHKVK